MFNDRIRDDNLENLLVSLVPSGSGPGKTQYCIVLFICYFYYVFSISF